MFACDGLALRVWELGCEIPGIGGRVYRAGLRSLGGECCLERVPVFRVWTLVLRIWGLGLGLRGQGLGFRI